MKKSLFIILSLLLSLGFFLFSPDRNKDNVEIYAETDSHLLLPQKNVVIIVMDLKQSSHNLFKKESLEEIKKFHQELGNLSNVMKVDSLMNASVIASRDYDIVVSRIIPDDSSEITENYLNSLAHEIPLYPELGPYVNKTQDTLLFYVYYGYKARTVDMDKELEELQELYKDILPFEYTGRGPIIAKTESLLTKDIVLFFPLLLVMVLAVFLTFRSWKAMGAALSLIVISVATAYGFIRFLGIPDSPLILLIPVFSLGLLSDYIIHYFYHQLYEPLGKNKGSVRRQLLFPLSLTALSTLTGFLSLIFINASGHMQLGSIIASAVVITWLGVFFWFSFGNYTPHEKVLFPRFQKGQARFFAYITRFRMVIIVLLTLAVIWGILQIPRLKIEPYPIEQLPSSTTIKKADQRINQEFFGTLPFFIEFDTGKENGIMTLETLKVMDQIQNSFQDTTVGYSLSIYNIMRRINYYFIGDEDFLNDPYNIEQAAVNEYHFPSLIQQFLLYYSSSVDPLEYESLLDSSYRFFSIKGMLYYENVENLDSFYALLEEMENTLPEGWSYSVQGMVSELQKEKENLRKNWVISFLIGSFLIFITVLIFYKKIGLAFLSLIPGVISMVISFGIIRLVGISIDAFSIIFVAIITGLVIDYSIHTLVALDKMDAPKNLQDGFAQIIGYSGVPIFLSFLTSLLSFSVLFLSSFKGARSLGILLVTSLILSFFLSLYLLPLIILPYRIKKESKK